MLFVKIWFDICYLFKLLIIIIIIIIIISLFTYIIKVGSCWYCKCYTQYAIRYTLRVSAPHLTSPRTTPEKTLNLSRESYHHLSSIIYTIRVCTHIYDRKPETTGGLGKSKQFTISKSFSNSIVLPHTSIFATIFFYPGCDSR